MNATTGSIQDGRARLSFDFDEEDDTQGKAFIDRKVEEISHQAGFTARRAPAPSVSVREDEPSQLARPRRRRAKTGRTFPFNTKIKPEIYDQICALADQATTEEGRPVSLAEIIERAVEALDASSSK